jgi:glycosyltransferase involved in cell wall biosynthesis
MPHPLVSIVTPSYNQGHFIRATIESVLNQNYPNVEYIIMDGGSTDETASVVRDYASRLTFVSEKDRGQSHAINKGFRMARGSILAWLNSDDLYLPGSIRAAVDGFDRNPDAGAVYGEGYLIDYSGEKCTRFPCTEPFNLWKLTYLSDYILQQTVYFRRDVLDEVGGVDEDLHYTMDWDLLIRIGMKYPLVHIPEFMGCLREYPDAKSFTGGTRRIREIGGMLRRHTSMRISPGYVVYGLDTYHQIWCQKVEELFTPRLSGVSKFLQSAIRWCAGAVIGNTIANSQGLHSDGWAGRLLRYMLPPGNGPLVIEGSIPDWVSLRRQRLHIEANERKVGQFDLTSGNFRLEVPLPPDFQGQALRLKIKASRSLMPGRFTLAGDRRRLAYCVKSIQWAEPAVRLKPLARTASAEQ